MSQHDMGPSDVEGFESQCRKCKALDTEIKFALGQDCPVPDEPEPQTTLAASPVSGPVSTIHQMNYEQHVIAIQANWFEGYFQRQFDATFRK